MTKINEAGENRSVVGQNAREIVTPAGIASDAAGDVFLANYAEQEIDELVGGEGGWRKVVAGSTLHPTGIVVKPSGNLLVAEKDNNYMRLYDPTKGPPAYGLLTTYGAAGSGSGQFNEPFGVAQAPNGTVYVADAGNHRIQRWVFEVSAVRPQLTRVHRL